MSYVAALKEAQDAARAADDTFDPSAVQRNCKIMTRVARKVCKRYPARSSWFERIGANGQPMLFGSCDDGAYILRSWGLCFIGHYEFALYFPAALMGEANEIARDLIRGALENQSTLQAGKTVLAARFGLVYKTKLEDVELAPVWKECNVMYPFTGISVTFSSTVAPVVNCMICKSIIETDVVRCDVCNLLTYCSKRCKKKDKWHREFCKAIAEGNCLACQAPCNGECCDP